MRRTATAWLTVPHAAATLVGFLRSYRCRCATRLASIIVNANWSNIFSCYIRCV